MSSDTTVTRRDALHQPGAHGVVAQGTVECGALTVNMRICKTKMNILENGLMF